MSNLTETKEGEWLAIYPRFRPLDYHKVIYELSKENAQLKELLKECRKWVGVERNFAVPNEKVILQQLLTEIDEELKQDD